MQNGQNDNLGNEQIFSFTPTGDGSKPENSFSIDRDYGNVGNSVVSSLNSNQEVSQSTVQPENVIDFPQSSQGIFSQSPETTNEINGELRARPENITSAPKLSAPKIDPSSVQLGIPTETNPQTDNPNQTSKTIDITQFKRSKKGNISPETLKAVTGAVREFQKPGSSESPAELVDFVNQAREGYRGTFETPYYTGGKAA